MPFLLARSVLGADFLHSQAAAVAMRAVMHKSNCHHETYDRRCTPQLTWLSDRAGHVFCKTRLAQPRKPVFIRARGIDCPAL
jgi:hypothetical protein